MESQLGQKMRGQFDKSRIGRSAVIYVMRLPLPQEIFLALMLPVLHISSFLLSFTRYTDLKAGIFFFTLNRNGKGLSNIFAPFPSKSISSSKYLWQ